MDTIEQTIEHYLDNTLPHTGLRNFTVEHMAADLRMSKKTIYERYSSKRELIGTFIRNKVDKLQGELERKIGAETDPVRQLTVIFFTAQHIIIPFFVAMGNDVKKMYPEIWQEIENRRMAIISVYAATFEQIQKNGYVHSDISPDAFAAMLRILIQAFFQAENILTQRVSFIELSTGLFKTLLRGIFLPEHYEKFDSVLDEMQKSLPY